MYINGLFWGFSEYHRLFVPKIVSASIFNRFADTTQADNETDSEAARPSMGCPVLIHGWPEKHEDKKKISDAGDPFFSHGISLHKKDMGVSENSVPLNPMVNDHYPYEKWLFHWEY